MEIVIYGLNFMIMFLLGRYEYNSDNDKAIVIFSVGFLIIVVMNFIFGLMAQLDRKPIYKHYYVSAIVLIIAAIILSSV